MKKVNSLVLFKVSLLLIPLLIGAASPQSLISQPDEISSENKTIISSTSNEFSNEISLGDTSNLETDFALQANAADHETTTRHKLNEATDGLLGETTTWIYYYKEIPDSTETHDDTWYMETATDLQGNPTIGSFLNASLEKIWQSIDLKNSDVVKYYSSDPNKVSSSYEPFLKMEEENFYHILEIVKSYEWDTYIPPVSVFENSGFEITIVCQDTVITYLSFVKDHDGKYYVTSQYDNRAAQLSEYDFQEIKGFVDSSPEWPEKYIERYGYWYYSKYY